MGRIGIAVRLFWSALFGRVSTEQAQRLLAGKEEGPAAAVVPPQASPDHEVSRVVERRPTKPRRNDAITLLATLQREARFVDLVQEPLQQYSDQQIGAAAHDVLRDCHKVLARIFALAPVVAAAENSDYETPATIPAGRLQITGSPQGAPPYRGRLIHPGWEATQCQLPEWTGDAAANLVIAPAEIECKK